MKWFLLNYQLNIQLKQIFQIINYQIIKKYNYSDTFLSLAINVQSNIKNHTLDLIKSEKIEKFLSHKEHFSSPPSHS